MKFTRDRLPLLHHVEYTSWNNFLPNAPNCLYRQKADLRARGCTCESHSLRRTIEPVGSFEFTASVTRVQRYKRWMPERR
jgi:hypothetical protein